MSVSGGRSVVAFLQLFLSGSKTCVQNELQLSVPLRLTGAVLGERIMSCVTQAMHPKVALAFSNSLTLLTALLHTVT